MGTVVGPLWAGAQIGGNRLPAAAVYGIAAAVLVVAVAIAALLGRRSGRRALSQRLTALGTRLGIDPPEDDHNIETALSYLEQVTGAATEAVAESSADAIRLRRSLDTLPQGVVICDENGTVVYRNGRANTLMTSRHGDALAAQAVTELLEDAWRGGTAERTLDLYGPPRRTLTVRAHQIDDGRRPLGVIAMIEDVSERRRLEEIRRDFVANVSHELKTPMGALGLLAETLVSEPDVEVSQRLASRIHTEAFRVSRIIDDLLDLSRIESEEAPPREPVLVNLVMAEAVERVRATADQRGITITLSEPYPPVAVLGDRRQLVSAMHAMLENAVTYSYDGTAVTVSGTVVAEGLEPAEPLAAVAAVSPAATATIGSGQLSLSLGVPPAPPAESLGTVDPGATGFGPSGFGATGSGPSGFGVTGPNAAGAAPVGSGDPDTAPDGGTSTDEGGPNGAHAAAEAPDRSDAPSAAAWNGFAGSAAVGGTGSAATDGEPVSLGGPEPAAARPVVRETVRLSVADHGVGIPARDLDRIFERFYRVDHGRSRDTGGTGLGLSIVRHVANNHQGWVDVESREGEGSTFTLVLPLQPERAS
jgi:two-component system, OmpR family, sensor histidine kinase SenX3